MRKTLITLVTIFLILILSGCQDDGKCEFPNSGETNKSGEYGIFGTDEFDTMVCGYLVHEEEEILGEKVSSAYFEIIEFNNDNFRESIKEAIDEGNTVNRKAGEHYRFRSGCMEDGELTEIGAITDEETKAAMENASFDDPVVLSLSFEVNLYRRFGICQTLAHEIRVVE
jgi:hypothetical protein